MSPQEILQRTIALQADYKAGRIGDDAFIRHTAWLTWVAQGVPRATVEQLQKRMAEVADAARFVGENPTPAEVDAATSFISPAE
ncbi:hypothetical protein [Mycobacterium aquaticum]|uniref:Uncharacterized protein n=1 Tax=Mycobacterium aquaticum TaxID=1927124 RepID=A0A1X0B923_9MYCO|nr:hypothetical protein [Mycobacterium aquaticum]ORA38709.1 hypothetical protein BST13_04835 [Mycobacterium aquaticum]